MKTIKKISILGLLLLFSSAVTVKGTKLSKTYSSSEHNFQLSYPGTWKVADSKDPNFILLTGPIIDTTTHQTDGSIAIWIQNNSKVITTTEVYKAKMKEFESSLKDFKIIEEGEMSLGKVKCKYVIHRSTTESTPVSAVQFYFSNGKKSFIMEGKTAAETLGKYKDLYFDIAKSIEFTKK